MSAAFSPIMIGALVFPDTISGMIEALERVNTTTCLAARVGGPVRVKKYCRQFAENNRRLPARRHCNRG